MPVKSVPQTYLEPAELHRIFPLVTGAGNVPDYVKQNDSPCNGNPLQGQIDVLRELVKNIEGERDDLRRRLDEEAQERRKAADEIRRLTLLLTHQPERKTPQPEPAPKIKDGKGRLWGKLFGRIG